MIDDVWPVTTFLQRVSFCRTGFRPPVRPRRSVTSSICSSCVDLMWTCLNASSALIQLPLLALFSHCGYLKLTPHGRLPPPWVSGERYSRGGIQAFDWLSESSCAELSSELSCFVSINHFAAAVVHIRLGQTGLSGCLGGPLLTWTVYILRFHTEYQSIII